MNFEEYWKDARKNIYPDLGGYVNPEWVAEEAWDAALEEAEKELELATEYRQRLNMYESLCGQVYQMAGTVNAPIRFLDALSDASNGEIKEYDLLPVTEDEFK